MFNTTFRTLPDAFMKWHFRHFITTAMTGFWTGKPLVEFYQVNTFFCCLVLQLCDEAVPACITYRSCQIVVFHHVGCFQRLHNYRLVFVNNCTRELVLKISTGIRYSPKLAVSVMVNNLKSVSSRLLRQQNTHLRMQSKTGLLWSRSYFACSSGGATIETLSAYVQSQSTPDWSLKPYGLFALYPRPYWARVYGVFC